jgi:hypothetical protein
MIRRNAIAFLVFASGLLMTAPALASGHNACC